MPISRTEERRRLLEAEAELARQPVRLVDAITMALRGHRAALRLSQRAYAERRGWSKTRGARLESEPGSIRLSDVMAALEATDWELRLVRTLPAATAGTVTRVRDADDGDDHDGDGDGADPSQWPRAELVARDRSHRRFPAVGAPRRVGMPATWFFARHEYAEPEPVWTWERPWWPPPEDEGG